MGDAHRACPSLVNVSRPETAMNTSILRLAHADPRACYRPLLLALAGIGLLALFWFASRYPSLLSKASHVGQAVPSMAFSSEVMSVASDAPLWQRVAVGALNWLNTPKIGMSFGVAFGALLHTVLRHYPLRVGNNLVLNSLTGALVGVPMAVCANCAVPAACGVTRGNGRIEVALGFLFSSPNFNPVVVAMTFAALPWQMGAAKYALLLLVIVGLVPWLIHTFERDEPFAALAPAACNIEPPRAEPAQGFFAVGRSLAREYLGHVWMLLKPTIALMLLASVAASLLLTLVPWPALLSELTPARLALVALVSAFMPVPIALDVMFAAQLQQQGVAAGYVMLFAMTLGTFSIVPAVYLWREVSRPLAAALFGFFTVTGFLLGLVF
jgi:uncharacterized membrane protein YraQ (UPF0718 family)